MLDEGFVVNWNSAIESYDISVRMTPLEDHGDWNGL